MSELKLVIPSAPDILFQKERTGHLLNETQPVYLIEKQEAVEHLGILTYYKNVPYARKGFPTPEALYAINQVKKILLEGAKLCKNPFFILGIVTSNKTKLCQSFNIVFDKIFGVHIVKEEFMCRSAFNWANFAHSVLVDLGVDNIVAKQFSFNIGQILEYDDAYRYRFQDLMTEFDVNSFVKSPKKEIKRLTIVLKQRSENQVPDKILTVLNLVLIFLPFIEKSLVRHAQFLKQAQLDEHDRYWVCMRNDHYNYLGLPVEKRHELYTERPIAYQVTA